MICATAATAPSMRQTVVMISTGHPSPQRQVDPSALPLRSLIADSSTGSVVTIQGNKAVTPWRSTSFLASATNVLSGAIDGCGLKRMALLGGRMPQMIGLVQSEDLQGSTSDNWAKRTTDCRLAIASA